MNLIEFVKQFSDDKNLYTKIYLEWLWIESGLDEEYCFEGSPSEFIEKYTIHYDCLDGINLSDVSTLIIHNEGGLSEIFISIERE